MEVHNIPRTHTAKNMRIAKHRSLEDLGKFLAKSPYAASQMSTLKNVGSSWTGDDPTTALGKLYKGEDSFVAKAERLADKFANLSIQTLGVDNAYNPIYGAVDIGALNAGVPDHLYGPTMTHTEKAPVAITLDTWVAANAKKSAIAMRGIAAMALAQAVSLYRPVSFYIVDAVQYRPSSLDVVQIVQLPTAPLNISRCMYAVAGTSFSRVCMISGVNATAENTANCSLPPLSRGKHWQETQLPKFVAPYLGVDQDSIVHLPLMLSNSGITTEAAAEQWVKKWVKKLVEV